MSGRTYRQTRRQGVHMLRIATVKAGGRVPGQPGQPTTDPARIRHRELSKHTCSECFGPRSAYQQGLFCASCTRALFGDARNGYGIFIRSERARQRELGKRRRAREAAS